MRELRVVPLSQIHVAEDIRLGDLRLAVSPRQRVVADGVPVRPLPRARRVSGKPNPDRGYFGVICDSSRASCSRSSGDCKVTSAPPFPTQLLSWIFGQQCVKVNGTSDGDVTGRQIHTDVIGYSRCKGECPGEGSEIKITDVAKMKSIDIKFNGGRQATFTGPNGKITQVLLACGL